MRSGYQEDAAPGHVGHAHVGGRLQTPLVGRAPGHGVVVDQQAGAAPPDRLLRAGAELAHAGVGGAPVAHVPAAVGAERVAVIVVQQQQVAPLIEPEHRAWRSGVAELRAAVAGAQRPRPVPGLPLVAGHRVPHLAAVGAEGHEQPAVGQVHQVRFLGERRAGHALVRRGDRRVPVEPRERQPVGRGRSVQVVHPHQLDVAVALLERGAAGRHPRVARPVGERNQDLPGGGPVHAAAADPAHRLALGVGAVDGRRRQRQGVARRPGAAPVVRIAAVQAAGVARRRMAQRVQQVYASVG